MAMDPAIAEMIARNVRKALVNNPEKAMRLGPHGFMKLFEDGIPENPTHEYQKQQLMENKEEGLRIIAAALGLT